MCHKSPDEAGQQRCAARRIQMKLGSKDCCEINPDKAEQQRFAAKVQTKLGSKDVLQKSKSDDADDSRGQRRARKKGSRQRSIDLLQKAQYPQNC